MTVPKSLEAQVADAQGESSTLRGLISQLRAFAQHDRSCPWFGHPRGEKNISKFPKHNYIPGPVSGPCRCGLGALDAKIDEAVP